MLALVLTGCGSQASTDLEQALVESHTAVESSLQALDLYRAGRSTRAVAETVLLDMGEQISDAQSQLQAVQVSSSADQHERDLVAAAVADGVAAVLHSRDDLQLHSDATSDLSALTAAEDQIRHELSALRQPR